jgi:hypothetical protein
MGISVRRRTLCVVYAFIAALAFIGTWIHGIKYIEMHLGFWGFWKRYYADSLINLAGRSNLIDLYLFGFAVFIWMVMEARRLKMRFIWLYPPLFLLIGISTFVPLFMIRREQALAAQEGGTVAGTMTRLDVAGLTAAIVGLIVIVVAVANMTWHWWT